MTIKEKQVRRYVREKLRLFGVPRTTRERAIHEVLERIHAILRGS